MARAQVSEIFATYETLKRQQGRLDLDDLLGHATTLISTNAQFQAAVAWRFHHVALDETQDLNPAQLALILAICGNDPDLTFVGDPNQSIYGWNGSDATLMSDLSGRFPNIQTVHLRSNKRSSRHIVDTANAALGATGFISEAADRGSPPTVSRFASDADEARAIAEALWRNEFAAGTLKTVAILARTNSQLQAVANALDAICAPPRRHSNCNMTKWPLIKSPCPPFTGQRALSGTPSISLVWPTASFPTNWPGPMKPWPKSSDFFMWP